MKMQDKTQQPNVKNGQTAALYLKECFLEIARKNPQFSLRAFSKKLGITPSGLSQVLSGKKRLSYERAHEIATKLELSPKELEYFLLLVQVEATKKSALKSQILEKMQAEFPERATSLNLTIDQFKMISEWYGIAVLEVLSVMGPDWSPKKIADYLGITKTEVELMIARFERLELIEKTPTGYRRIANHVLYEAKVPNDVVRSFYQNCLPKIASSIEEQSQSEKVTGAEYFAFDPKDLEQVREATEAYFQTLIKIAAKGKDKTEVYQAFVNVYRMNLKTGDKK